MRTEIAHQGIATMTKMSETDFPGNVRRHRDSKSPLKHRKSVNSTIDKTLLRWNETLNVTAIRDPVEIRYRHLGDSCVATVAIPVEKGSLPDIGIRPVFSVFPLKSCGRWELLPGLSPKCQEGTFLRGCSRTLTTNTRVLIRRYEEL